jgi:phosphatidylglycerophosphate synthase
MPGRREGCERHGLERPTVLIPSVYNLKAGFQGLLRPTAGRLIGAGVTPNAVTLTTLVGSVGVGAVMPLARRWPGLLFLLPVWLLARMALNALDGMMAREWRMATPLGAVLNELGDVIADLGLYLPLAFVWEPARWAVVAFGIGAVLTEFCGVLGRALGAERQYQGPMGKSDRALLVGALGLITAALPALFRFWPWVFGLAAPLLAATCWNRIAAALARLRADGDAAP